MSMTPAEQIAAEFPTEAVREAIRFAEEYGYEYGYNRWQEARDELNALAADWLKQRAEVAALEERLVIWERHHNADHGVEGTLQDRIDELEEAVLNAKEEANRRRLDDHEQHVAALAELEAQLAKQRAVVEAAKAHRCKVGKHADQWNHYTETDHDLQNALTTYQGGEE